jgi:hypothetical protein
MNLQELQQVKQDLANGIIISRSQWVKVLDAAIAYAPGFKPWTEEQTTCLRKQLISEEGVPTFSSIHFISSDIPGIEK